MRCVRKTCCKKHCIEAISPGYTVGNLEPSYQFIKSCRYDMNGLDHGQRKKFYYDKIEGYLFLIQFLVYFYLN